MSWNITNGVWTLKFPVSKLAAIQKLQFVTESKVSGNFSLFAFTCNDKIQIETVTISNTKYIIFNKCNKYYSQYEVSMNCNINEFTFNGQIFNIENEWSVGFCQNQYVLQNKGLPSQIIIARMPNKINCNTLRISLQPQDFCFSHLTFEENTDNNDTNLLNNLSSGTLIKINFLKDKLNVDIESNISNYEHKVGDHKQITLKSLHFGCEFKFGILLGHKEIHVKVNNDISGNIDLNKQQGIPYLNHLLIKPTTHVFTQDHNLSDNEIETHIKWKRYRKFTKKLTPIWNIIKHGKLNDYDLDIPKWSFDHWICSKCDNQEEMKEDKCSVCGNKKPDYERQIYNFIRLCLGLSSNLKPYKCDEYISQILKLIDLMNNKFKIKFEKSVLSSQYNNNTNNNNNNNNNGWSNKFQHVIIPNEDELIMQIPPNIISNQQILNYLLTTDIKLCEECSKTLLWSKCKVCGKQKIPPQESAKLTNIGSSSRAWYKYHLQTFQEFEIIDHPDSFWSAISMFMFGVTHQWENIKMNSIKQLIIHKGYFHNYFENDIDFSSFVLNNTRFGCNIEAQIILAVSVAIGHYIKIYSFNNITDDIELIFDSQVEGDPFWKNIKRPTIKIAKLINDKYCLLKDKNTGFKEQIDFPLPPDVELGQRWFEYWRKQTENFSFRCKMDVYQKIFQSKHKNKIKRKHINNKKANAIEINESVANFTITTNNKKYCTYKDINEEGSAVITFKDGKAEALIILAKSAFKNFCEILIKHTHFDKEINKSNFNLARDEFTHNYNQGIIKLNNKKFDPNLGIIVNLCHIHGNCKVDSKNNKKKPLLNVILDTDTETDTDENEDDDIKQICLFDECKIKTTHAHCIHCDKDIKFTGLEPFKAIQDHCKRRHYKRAEDIFARKLEFFRKDFLVYYEGTDVYQQNSSCFFPKNSKEYHKRMQAHNVWHAKNQILSVIKDLHMGSSLPTFQPVIMCHNQSDLHKNWFALYYVNNVTKEQAVGKIININYETKMVTCKKYICKLNNINSNDKSDNVFKKRFHTYDEEDLIETEEIIEIAFDDVLNCCEDYNTFYINWGKNVKSYINQNIQKIDNIFNDPIILDCVKRHYLFDVIFPTHFLTIINTETNQPSYPYQCKHGLGHNTPCKYEQNTNWNYLKTPAITKNGLLEIVTQQFKCVTHDCLISVASGKAKLGPKQKLSLNFRRQGRTLFETDVINVLYRIIGDQSGWTFQKCKRIFFDRICTATVDKLVDYCQKQKIILPHDVIRFLCGIIKTLPNKLPWIGTFRNLILEIAQPSMVQPYQSRVFPILQATQNVIRIDGSHKTCKNVKTNVMTVEWDEKEKKYVEDVQTKSMSCCWLFCSDEIGCSTYPALLVGAENSQAVLKLFVKILSEKQKFVQQHKNLPAYKLYPTLIVGDKPSDLFNPFYKAATLVNGEWNPDKDDGRFDVLFARDIFHELQQHCGHVSSTWDKERTVYCADISQVFYNLRGIPRPIPSNIKFDEKILACFSTVKIKELIKNLLKNKENVFQDKGFVCARGVLNKLIKEHQMMSQWYIGAVLLDVPPNQKDDFIIDYINDKNEKITFKHAMFPSHLYCKLLTKLFPNTNIDKTNTFQTWDFVHSTPEQFKYHLKNIQLWYQYYWTKVDGTLVDFYNGITRSNIIKHEYEKIFKEPKFTWLFNNRYDGCCGIYGTSIQESHHSPLQKVPILRRSHCPITAIKIVNDIQCRQNFSILNKHRNFIIAESDRKMYYNALSHALNLYEKLSADKLGIEVFNHLFIPNIDIKNNQHVFVEDTLNDIGFFPGRGSWSKQSSCLLSRGIDELLYDISKCVKVGGLLNYLAFKCNKTQKATDAELKKNHLRKYETLKERCMDKYHSLRFYTMADNNVKVHEAIKDVSKSNILDVLRPGLQECDEVKKMKKMTIKINKKFNLKNIIKTQKNKKISIPTDLYGNKTTNDKLLQTLRIFINNNENKMVQDWDWQLFCNKINFKYNESIVNCLIFYLYHCFFKQSEIWLGTDRAKKLWEMLNLGNDHKAWINGSAVPLFKDCASIIQISEKPIVKLVSVVPAITLSGKIQETIEDDDNDDIEIIEPKSVVQYWQQKVTAAQVECRKKIIKLPPKLINNTNSRIDFEYNAVGLEQDKHTKHKIKRDIKRDFKLKNNSVMKDNNLKKKVQIRKNNNTFWQTGTKILVIGKWLNANNKSIIEELGGKLTTHPETKCYKYIIGDIARNQIKFGIWTNPIESLKNQIKQKKILWTQVVSESYLLYIKKENKELNVLDVPNDEVFSYWPLCNVKVEQKDQEKDVEPPSKKRKLNSGIGIAANLV